MGGAAPSSVQLREGQTMDQYLQDAIVRQSERYLRNLPNIPSRVAGAPRSPHPKTEGGPAGIGLGASRITPTGPVPWEDQGRR